MSDLIGWTRPFLPLVALVAIPAALLWAFLLIVSTQEVPEVVQRPQCLTQMLSDLLPMLLLLHLDSLLLLKSPDPKGA